MNVRSYQVMISFSASPPFMVGLKQCSKEHGTSFVYLLTQCRHN